MQMSQVRSYFLVHLPVFRSLQSHILDETSGGAHLIKLIIILKK